MNVFHYVASYEDLINKCNNHIGKNLEDHEDNVKIIKYIAKKYPNLKNKNFDYYSYIYNYITHYEKYLNENIEFDIEKICYTWITIGYPNNLKIIPYHNSEILLKDYVKNHSKIGLITSINKELLKKYGYKFFETLSSICPYDLYVGHEDNLCLDDIHKYTTKKNIITVSLEDDEELNNFIKRNKEKNECEKKEHFLKDAIRFSYKVFSIANIVKTQKCYDYFIWIDADVIFRESKSLFIYDNIKEFIKDDTMMSYLSRMNGKHKQYSECGFLIFNMNHEYTHKYIDEMKYMYVKDLIYKEKEYHDSWIWDVLRNKYEKEYNVKNYPIPNDGLYYLSKGNVMLHSKLNNYMYHPKGENMKENENKFKRFVEKKDIRVSKFKEKRSKK